MFSNISKKTFFLLPALFLSSYVIGAGAGSLTSAAAEGNWGLSFMKKTHRRQLMLPQMNLHSMTLIICKIQMKKYSILHLMQDTKTETQKKFRRIKKHDVSAAFFVVGTYIESNPELVKRMCKDGHIVGNHTWHHPDMSQMSTLESFKKN